MPQRAFDQSPLMRAILESGYTWEDTLLKTRLAGKVVIAQGEGDVHSRRFDVPNSIEQFRKAKCGTFIYQPTIRVSDEFYRAFDLDPNLVTFSDNHPDLIAVQKDSDGQRLLRVLDVKRGDSLRQTHRVQVLLYALLLHDVVQRNNIEKTKVDLDCGGVWLGGAEEPTWFDLNELRPHVESFLRDDLMGILKADADDVPWHLYFRCEWCEFFDHCRGKMKESNDISRIAYLSRFGKQHLVDEAGVRTVPELAKFLKGKNADEVLSRCASLAGQRPYLENQVKALESDAITSIGASTPALPILEDIALFLTIQDEPLGNSIYLTGMHAKGKSNLLQEVFTQEIQNKIFNENGKLKPHVILAKTADQSDTVVEKFIVMLHKILVQVDRYNRKQKEWSEQISLQAYVHSDKEKSLLISTLLNALHQPDLAERAMALLFYLQVPELLLLDKHPSSEVAYPVVVLTDVLSKVLALPVEVSYTLPEALKVMESSFTYHRNDYYHFPLGHGLRAEAIHSVWFRGKDLYEEITKQAEMHLYATSALLQSLRKRAKESLFAWPPKLQIPDAEAFEDQVISKLIFFAKYESLMDCLAIREQRCDVTEAQLLLGKAIRLQAIDDVTMDVVGTGLMEVEENPFAPWLLVDDNSAGRQAQLEFRDYVSRKKSWAGKSSPHRAIVSIAKLKNDEFGFPKRLTFKYDKPFEDRTPREGQQFILYPRFTDYTTDNVVSFLLKLDGTKALFTKLLDKPEACNAQQSLTPGIEAYAKKHEAKLNLTTSQNAAYRATRKNKVTVVWGPPGTGKTHFLASIIVGLMESHLQAAKPFRVLVTAFTHAAIENLLRKVEEVATQLQCTSFELAKVKRWQSRSTASVDVLDEKQVASWIRENDYFVLGSTSYSCIKSYDEVDGYDLVVVDEASQVRVTEASVPISLVARSGRLLLAGDHLQLPPIVAGRYPEPEEGEPILHRSIFEALSPRVDGKLQPTVQLLENFRMNDVLTKTAAKLLYGNGYHCFDQSVADRRLRLTTSKKKDELFDACFDPAFPLVVVVMEGVKAAKENKLEADCVANLVAALRDRTAKEFKDDESFFRHGVFIVCPHRAQIRAIRSKLAEIREWESVPFVDTVDKMQGQESESVIVSYGVSDAEFAMQEAEFIYSLNRLNVAMTRAKSKCVIFLPKPLLDATPHILEEPEVAKGLGFMRELVALVESTGELIPCTLQDGVVANVFRTKSVP